MERDGFRQDEPRTHSKGGGTVVRLSRRRRASHRLNRFLKRRGFPWLWAAVGAILLAGNGPRGNFREYNHEKNCVGKRRHYISADYTLLVAVVWQAP